MTATAQIEQPHPMIPQSEAILPDIKLRQTSCFAFFAGNHLTDSERYAIPSRFMGGVELDMFLTLKETGKELYARPDLYNTGGIIYRCAITQLKTFYLPVNPNMVMPADRDPEGGKFVPGYVKQNGRRNHTTGQYEDVTVSGQLYRPFYPGDEIESLTRPSTGLRPGGIVEITALHGKGWEEQVAAQLHFFPNWERIQTEQDAFPKTLKELREGIVSRMAGASIEMQSVGRDMLRSCDEFRLWGLRYLKAWRQIVKFADTSVDSPIAGYNELCEMLFDLLSVNREDTLGQQRDETGAIDKLANILLSRLQPGEQQPVDPMEGMAVVDVQPGFVIPQAPVNQEAIDGLTGTSIPDVQTHTTTGNTPENFTPENDPASQPQGVINVGVKVTVIADGREGLVTWKGPNNKIKLAFEDGGTVTLDKDEVIANA
jgi:hypothetical protein